MTKNGNGRYAAVNGLKLYYEIHAAGEPLILPRGGVVGIEMFAPVLPALAEHRQVIAVDLQGHGRTVDVQRPLRFELMADDIDALMKVLGIKSADILGYSLGGGVAMLTAIQHPEAVNRLVVISTPCKRSGWHPEVLAAMGQMGPQAAVGMKRSPLAKLYADVDWAVLFTKLAELLKTDYDSSKNVATLKARR